MLLRGVDTAECSTRTYIPSGGCGGRKSLLPSSSGARMFSWLDFDMYVANPSPSPSPSTCSLRNPCSDFDDLDGFEPPEPPMVTRPIRSGRLLPAGLLLFSPVKSAILSMRGRNVGRQALTTALACSIMAHASGSIRVPVTIEISGSG